MINMSVSIESNAGELAYSLKTKPENIKKGMETGLDESADLGVRTMKAAHNPFSKTGKTLRSIKSVSNGDFSRSMGPMTDDKVPIFLEKGTKPHIITGNPWLYWPGAKHPVKKVNHPGTTPRPFVEPAHRTLKVMFSKIMAKNINNAFK